jgi:hypothetical protein
MRASSASGQKNKNTKETATDWIKNMRPNKVIGDAQRILKTAVDVLEEEIAAGILAAKRLEKKVINVDEVRSTNPEELMSRVRRDVHDAVDIFLDAVTALTNHFSSLTENITKTKEATVTKSAASSVAIIRHDGKAKGGENIELQMLLTNESRDQQKLVALNKADLINAQGNKILSRYITIEPQSFSLAPLDKKEVLIKIRVPLTCKSGIYSGLFQDNNDADIKTVVTIEVE